MVLGGNYPLLLIRDFVILVSAHTGHICTPFFPWLYSPRLFLVGTGLKVWEYKTW